VPIFHELESTTLTSVNQITVFTEKAHVAYQKVLTTVPFRVSNSVGFERDTLREPSSRASSIHLELVPTGYQHSPLHIFM